jgi:hypothetical protein
MIVEMNKSIWEGEFAEENLNEDTVWFEKDLDDQDLN